MHISKPRFPRETIRYIRSLISDIDRSRFNELYEFGTAVLRKLETRKLKYGWAESAEKGLWFLYPHEAERQVNCGEVAVFVYLLAREVTKGTGIETNYYCVEPPWAPAGVVHEFVSISPKGSKSEYIMDYYGNTIGTGKVGDDSVTIDCGQVHSGFTQNGSRAIQVKSVHLLDETALLKKIERLRKRDGYREALEGGQLLRTSEVFGREGQNMMRYDSGTQNVVSQFRVIEPFPWHSAYLVTVDLRNKSQNTEIVDFKGTLWTDLEGSAVLYAGSTPCDGGVRRSVFDTLEDEHRNDITEYLSYILSVLKSEAAGESLQVRLQSLYADTENLGYLYDDKTLREHFELLKKRLSGMLIDSRKDLDEATYRYVRLDHAFAKALEGDPFLRRKIDYDIFSFKAGGQHMLPSETANQDPAMLYVEAKHIPIMRHIHSGNLAELNRKVIRLFGADSDFSLPEPGH